MEIKGRISFLVVRGVGLELVLALPGGEEVAVNKRELSRWGVLSGATVALAFRSPGDLKESYKILCALIRHGGSALIPIKPAGKGPTEKSRKIRVSGVVYRYQIPPGGDVEERKEHTLTIPVSQIVDRDGDYYAPRWLLRKTLHERVLGGKSWPASIDGGVWFGADALWEAVFEPIEKQMISEAAEYAQRQAARVRAEKKTAARQKARWKIEAVARAAAEAERQREKARAVAKKEERMESLEHIQAERVEWDEWVSFKNKYGSKSHKKVTRVFENCTLYFSGQRVYVRLEDGQQIIKTRDTVRWGGEAAA